MIVPATKAYPAYPFFRIFHCIIFASISDAHDMSRNMLLAFLQP